MKKSSFLTFCFAFMPGAGQMYLGYLKRGASFMAVFFAVCALAAFLGLQPLLFLLPIIWFYAFFDTFNIKHMTDEQRLQTKDDYFFDIDKSLLKSFIEKNNLIVGGVFIFLGIYMLYSNLLLPVLGRILDSISYDMWWIWNILNSVPTLFIAVVIIYIGLRLVRGPRQTMAAIEQDSDFTEFKGEEDNTDVQ